MSRKTNPKATPLYVRVENRRMQDALYGVRAEDIARICGVDLTTARRWKSGQSRIPRAAAALVSGDLGAFAPEWEGWRIKGEEILSPDGWVINRNHALSLPLMERQLRDRDEKIKELEAELKAVQGLEDQPLPEAHKA